LGQKALETARVGPRTFAIPPELEGALDRAVRGAFGSSWGQARAWIEGGKVRVGERVVLDPTARVRAGEQLLLDERAPRARSGAVGELQDSELVHVDAHVVVVAKPPGICTVPYEDGMSPASPGRGRNLGEREDTLDARVRRWLERQARRGARTRPNLGIVHRLDKETSGLVVFTRTWLAKQSLASQFRAHTVHRRYLAIAHGSVRAGTVRTHLLENRGDGLRGSARGTPPPSARLAITHFELLEELRGASLIACRLETGRTHQIRIHLSESGHPLVGESVYVRGWPGPLIEAPRLMLHAAELGFVHPVTQSVVSWELPLPADMRAMAERLRG
jgi:23S rRNA pseudouridine1911/1915/1917 synthase